MKADKKISTKKLAERFDNELKNLLMEDLRSFKSKNQFFNFKKHQVVTQTLSAA